MPSELSCPLLSPLQVNDWQKDWVAFYVQQRIQPQMDMVEKGSGDREALELWSALQVRGAPPRPEGGGRHSRCGHLGVGLHRRCTRRCGGAGRLSPSALLRPRPAPQLKIPDLFRDLDIVPALLHGDLWGGNVAEDASGPVIFDPASFYGHSEYELAIAGMFGGFSGSFYAAYHSRLPRAPGFERRLQLYQLFHYLNHWNHFGAGYRGSSLSIMKKLSR